MEDGNQRFDEDETIVNFRDMLEFDEHDVELKAEAERLIACVRAARCAGV